ncbi:MAG: P22 coat protein - protein 5 domain protein [Acidobacteria bacterium]|nr:P22 coat protein - protein 5 domain protein [Acidobacteriota bacterium]
MALDNFIPTIWTARLLISLDKALVYGQSNVSNRDYEGEIRQAGNSVKINSIGDVTVKPYVKNTDIDAPETLVDSSQMLNITQAEYFNFAVDNVDAAQSNVNVMSEAMRRAAHRLSDVADQFIAAKHVEVPSANMIGNDGAPIAVDLPAKAYENLVDLGTKLDEANVESEGRFCVIPPWFYALLLKDNRFVAAGTSKTDEVLRNGQVGEAAGFTLLKSNNVPHDSGTKYKIIAGVPMAHSYADQVVEVKAYEKEKGFADGVKGLHVYGSKLVRPYCWAVLTANKS